MQTKRNCKFNNQGVWCTNKKIKSSLFGLGTRSCSDAYSANTCTYKEKLGRPVAPPPPPKKVD